MLKIEKKNNICVLTIHRHYFLVVIPEQYNYLYCVMHCKQSRSDLKYAKRYMCRLHVNIATFCLGDFSVVRFWCLRRFQKPFPIDSER